MQIRAPPTNMHMFLDEPHTHWGNMQLRNSKRLNSCPFWSQVSLKLLGRSPLASNFKLPVSPLRLMQVFRLTQKRYPKDLNGERCLWWESFFGKYCPSCIFTEGWGAACCSGGCVPLCWWGWDWPWQHSQRTVSNVSREPTWSSILWASGFLAETVNLVKFEVWGAA